MIPSSSLPLALAGLWLAGLGVPLPEDPLLLAAGALSHRGALEWWLTFPIVFASAIGADCTLFLLARHFGERLAGRQPFRTLLTQKRRASAERLFERHGARTVFFGRHVWGLRPVVFILAGLHRMEVRRFVMWDALGGLVTIPLVFALGYLFSRHLEKVELGLATAEHWGVAVLGVAALAWLTWTSFGRHAPKGGR